MNRVHVSQMHGVRAHFQKGRNRFNIVSTRFHSQMIDYYDLLLLFITNEKNNKMENKKLKCKNKKEHKKDNSVNQFVA